VKVRRNHSASRIARNWRRALLWIASLGLTYATGKLAVDLVKWIILTDKAPTVEAKLILVGYLVPAVLPVLLLGLPAAWAWHRLLRAERADAALVLGLELVILAYVGVADVQRALANFVE